MQAAEAEQALAKDAQEQARQVKRKHRRSMPADPRRFRKIVRLAQSAVFRQKPGPKPDRKAARRIAHAARRRARGTEWEELYQRFIPDYGKLNAVTRDYAEDSSNARDDLKMSSVGHIRVCAARRRPATCLGA